MIHPDAFFTLSYGLYIVSSGNKDKGNGFISNSVFQVTANPPQFASCCNKDNYTAELIKETGYFGLTILHQEASADIIGTFGYKSGRDINKLEGKQLLYGESGVPIILNDAVSYMELRVVNTFDVGTHLVFIGELINSQMVDGSKPCLTYDYYRNVKKGLAPKNAPTYVDKSKFELKATESRLKQYKCTACGYIYEESLGDTENNIQVGTLFEHIPSDWTCPICGAEKEDFITI